MLFLPEETESLIFEDLWDLWFSYRHKWVNMVIDTTVNKSWSGINLT